LPPSPALRALQGENCNGHFLCRSVTYAPSIFFVLNLVVA
jgi:hypothetical protein